MKKLGMALGVLLILAVCVWVVGSQKSNTSNRLGKYKIFISRPSASSEGGGIREVTYLLDTQTGRVWKWGNWDNPKGGSKFIEVVVKDLR